MMPETQENSTPVRSYLVKARQQIPDPRTEG
jgi:hypothetical protein